MRNSPADGRPEEPGPRDPVEAPRLAGTHRERVVALLNDPGLKGPKLLARLREMRVLEGLPACSAALHLLAHMTRSEAEAEELLRELMRHREELSGRLGRDPGLHVAAIDYLSNVAGALRNPAVVEWSQLEQTERHAVTDSLTDLYNRRYFFNALDLEIRRGRRYSLELSLLLLDLDAFKSVNDVYGHPFGDRVLRRVGEVVRRAVRESDLACRFGGEEFAVILPETGRSGARVVGERVRCRVRDSFAETPVDGRLVAMTISGGVATYPADGLQAEVLIERADRALYRSKTTGRNRVVPHYEERRRSVRYPVHPDVRAQLAIPRTGVVQDAQVINLSRDGALLEILDAPDTAAVELVLDGLEAPCAIRGQVVRVEPESASSNELRRVAVAFDEQILESRLLQHVSISRTPSRGDQA